MSDWKLPWNASCLCGRIKMHITAPPVMSAACHCTGCQKLTSGAYSLTLMIPISGFEVEGQTQVGALHRAESQHHYCPHCLSWLFTRAPGLDTYGLLNFRSTMLENASWTVPFIESMTAEKLPTAQTGAKHSFEGFPPADAYMKLMQEYAAEGVRPG